MKPPLTLLAALLALAPSRAAEEKPAPTITFEKLAAPTSAEALAASLATAPDGTLWLSWIQSTDGETHALRFSTFDATPRKWSAIDTIAHGPNIQMPATSFPALVIDRHGTVAALWNDIHSGALFASSSDHGTTWTEPIPWTVGVYKVGQFSFVCLADGRILAAWLDDRGNSSGIKVPKLYSRTITSLVNLSDEVLDHPDTLIDSSVSNSCQISLTAFPDGGALLAYRGRTDENAHDIRTARFDDRAWADSRPLNNDDWRFLAGSATGPRLASDGGRVAAAWFTAATHDPRVLVSFSPDAGARFLQPLRVDHGKPAGPVDTAILHDGALLVTWLESDGSAWLCRITPDFTADAPVCLAPPRAPITNDPTLVTYPRLALLRDYAGGKTSAQLIVAFATDRAAPLRTLLVTVPEGDLLTAEKNCDCAPTAEQLQGFPLRGTIAAIDAAHGVLRVRHGETPGVLAAGTHEFAAASDILATVQPERQFLGRIERRSDGTWRLFDVRLFVEPPQK